MTNLQDLVRTANPAPEPEELLESMGRDDLFHDIRVRAGIDAGPLVESPLVTRRNRRWVVAVTAAAALIAAVVLTILFTATFSEDPDVITPPTPLPAPGESSSPVDIVTAFFSTWNEHDVAGALAYIHPDAHHSHAIGDEIGSVAWWDNYLHYSVAAYGGEWEWILRDCIELSDTAVQCRVGVAGEPLLDARAVPLTQRQFGTRDGFVMRALVPTDVTFADISADQYAKRRDPEAYAQACDIEGRELLGEFVVYDRVCGEFIAPYRLAYAQELLEDEPPLP